MTDLLVPGKNKSSQQKRNVRRTETAQKQCFERDERNDEHETARRATGSSVIWKILGSWMKKKVSLSADLTWLQSLLSQVKGWRGHGHVLRSRNLPENPSESSRQMPQAIRFYMRGSRAEADGCFRLMNLPLVAAGLVACFRGEAWGPSARRTARSETPSSAAAAYVHVLRPFHSACAVPDGLRFAAGPPVRQKVTRRTSSVVRNSAFSEQWGLVFLMRCKHSFVIAELVQNFCIA